MVDCDFWKGKRVFVTGHTGFKGSWLSLWLASLGAEVKGYALAPPTSPSLFEEAKVDQLITSQIADIRDLKTLRNSMMSFDPDVLIHMAAQPLVRYSYKEPLETYEVNVIGTVNVLEAARGCKNIRAIVNVTSDKCYENDNRIGKYAEQDSMGGYDPYSSSKGCAELVTAAYRRSFFHETGVGLASARAGNVIGGGDWADDRLIPDILRSFEAGNLVVIRNPNAVRPWQHVLEPLGGYLKLAQSIVEDPVKYSEGWNFGPHEEDARPVSWILDEMSKIWPGGSWELDQGNHPHEAGYLKLDISKARDILDWEPTWSLNQTLKYIVHWHRAWLSGENMQIISLDEIARFTSSLRSN